MTLEKFNELVTFTSQPCLFPALEQSNRLPTLILAFYSEIIIPYEAIRLAAETIKQTSGIEVFYVLGNTNCIKCDKNQIANLLMQNNFRGKAELAKSTKKIDVIYDLLVVFTIKNHNFVAKDSVLYCNILEDNWKNSLSKRLQYVCRPNRC